MAKIMKWIGFGLLGAVVLVLLAAASLFVTTSQRLSKAYQLPNEQIPVPVDEESVSRGKRWVTARCSGCHSSNLAGTILFQDSTLGTISAANLSAGKGINGVTLTDADYIRAIRHGVDHTGRPILTMPSEYFYYINDQELGEMIAYLKSAPAFDNPLPKTQIKPLGVVLIGAGAFGDLIAAEKIDHQATRPEVVQAGVTVAYGDYLVQTGQCRTCHGLELAGGKDSDPNAPPAPNLTSGGELLAWTEAGFIQAMRTGLTPSGRQLNQFMPWKAIGQMTDDELKAIWLYLQSLTPLPENK